MDRFISLNFVDDKYMIISASDDSNHEVYAVFRINWESDSVHDQVTEYYDYIGWSEVYTKHSMFLVSRDDKWGYVSAATGKELAMFDDASNFSNGYAIVTTNGMGHVVDSKLKVVSEDFPCDSTHTLGDGSFVVKNGDNYQRLVIS